MMVGTQLQHRFVEYFPEQLQPGILYISIEYATATHSCCCGCGEEVVTPFSPTDWCMTFDGKTVSLWPSIGNWSFPCRSHYIIERGQVIKAGNWTDEQVESNRLKDRTAKAHYYEALERVEVVQSTSETIVPPKAEVVKTRSSLIERCFKAVRRLWRNQRHYPGR